MPSQFWEDLKSDTSDPEFARAYAVESVRIATIDAVMNTLNDALIAEGMSKASLARATGMKAPVVRRLLSSATVNPTIGTVAGLAAALGMRLTFEPMSKQQRAEITTPMLGAAAL